MQCSLWGLGPSSRQAWSTHGQETIDWRCAEDPCEHGAKFVAEAKFKAVVDPNAAKRTADKAGRRVQTPPKQTAMGSGPWRFCFF